MRSLVIGFVCAVSGFISSEAIAGELLNGNLCVSATGAAISHPNGFDTGTVSGTDTLVCPAMLIGNRGYGGQNFLVYYEKVAASASQSCTLCTTDKYGNLVACATGTPISTTGSNSRSWFNTPAFGSTAGGFSLTCTVSSPSPGVTDRVTGYRPVESIAGDDTQARTHLTGHACVSQGATPYYDGSGYISNSGAPATIACPNNARFNGYLYARTLRMYKNSANYNTICQPQICPYNPCPSVVIPRGSPRYETVDVTFPVYGSGGLSTGGFTCSLAEGDRILSYKFSQ